MSQNQKDYGFSVGASLDFNNTYMPAIRRVEFTTFAAEPGKGRSVLRTRVEFADGTFVKVVNSANDKIDLVPAVKKLGKKTIKKTVEGKVVKTVVDNELDLKTSVASDTDKERAVIYAIVKRLIGVPGKCGEVKAKGFSSKLGKIIAEAVDTNITTRLNAIAEAEKKAKAEKKKAKAKARRDKAAAAAAAKEDRVDRLCGAVEKLAEAVASKSGN